jgi:serine/threonine-protein kinase RsbT
MTTVVEIAGEDDIVVARSEARRIAGELGMSLMDKTRVATAVSELARNIYVYAGNGRVTIDALIDPRCGIRCHFIDNGPGIEDISLVMQDGFTTGKSLGFGLPGAKRLSDEFNITSEPGEGTEIEIIKWK